MYSIKLSGDTRELLRRIRDFAEIDKKKINSVLGEALKSSAKERFKTEKSPEDKKWKTSLRASTESGKTLTKSAVLKNSIHKRSDASGFAVGTNVIYAATHQLGDEGRQITIKAKTSRGLVFWIGGKWIRKKQVTIKVKIPARPFLGISDEDRKEIKGTIEDFLKGE